MKVNKSKGLKLQRVKGVKLLNKNQENKEQQEYRPVPSSGTKVKHAKMKIAQAAITSFIVSGPVKPTNTEVLQVSKFHAL